jgi:pimeloyl-ACP methyl ester carboxylesterase
MLRLRDRFTCYAPDLIGLGQSHSSAAEDYSSQGQARALQGLLRELGVESYALVGNDTGGWIARELALVDGGRVSHLVLTNTEIPGIAPCGFRCTRRWRASPASGRSSRGCCTCARSAGLRSASEAASQTGHVSMGSSTS